MTLWRPAFFRIPQPRRFGGYEFDLTTLVRCLIEISSGCGSSGWALSLTAAHTWWAAQYPPEAQAELFGEDGDLRFPLIFAPTGKSVVESVQVPAGENLSFEERARTQLQPQHCASEAAAAVDGLFVGGGASTMNDGEPLQRCFRDTIDLRTHYQMDADRLQKIGAASPSAWPRSTAHRNLMPRSTAPTVIARP